MRMFVLRVKAVPFPGTEPSAQAATLTDCPNSKLTSGK
jgi:hypothetical protein